MSDTEQQEANEMMDYLKSLTVKDEEDQQLTFIGDEDDVEQLSPSSEEEDEQEANEMMEFLSSEDAQTSDDNSSLYIPDNTTVTEESTFQNDNIEPQDNDDAEKKNVLGAIFDVGTMIGTTMFGEDSKIGAVGGDIIEEGFLHRNEEGKLSGIVAKAGAGITQAASEGVQFVGSMAEALGRSDLSLAPSFNPTFRGGLSVGHVNEEFWEARKDPEYSKKVDEAFENFAIYDLAHAIEKGKKETFAESETFTGSAVEGLSQFFGPYGAMGLVNKAYRGYKGAYVKEIITGLAFFDPDDKNLTTFLKELGIHIPVITDILAKDDDDPTMVKRLKNVLEAVFVMLPFDAGKITDDILVINRHKLNVDKAKKELLDFGSVSKETAEELEKSAQAIGEVKPVDIELMVKEEIAEKVSKYSERIKKVRGATEANKKAVEQSNKKIADENLEMHNAIIEGFEEQLSPNRGLKRTDKDFVHVSKKVFGKRVLNSELLRSAKNMEARLSFEEIEAGKVMDTGESVSEIMIAPKGSDRELDDLFNKTLKPENIEALTVVFSEMKKARPELWDDSLPPMKASFEMVTKLTKEGNLMNFTKDHPLYDALEKAGMSFEDFTIHGLGAASEAGQILRSFRMIKESYATKSLKREYELRELLNKQGSVQNFIRRVENIRRGGLVSQIATAARNLSSGLLRSPVEAINNVVETAVYDMSRGNFIKGNRLFKRTTWQDSFAGLRYIYKDRKTAEEFTDFLLEQKELKTFYDQMFNTINEIQTNTGRGSGTKTDSVLTAGEDLVQLLNTPNRWQDFILRRATFIGEAQRLFRLEWDIDLLKELENGRIKDILRDADDLNPTKGRRSAVDIFAESTQRALDLTYANPPELAFNRYLSNAIIKNNLTVAIPFPRFMFKSMELMAENSAGVMVPILNRSVIKPFQRSTLKRDLNILKKKKNKNPAERAKMKKLQDALDDPNNQIRSGLSVRESRAVARNLTGVAAIMVL